MRQASGRMLMRARPMGVRAAVLPTTTMPRLSATATSTRPFFSGLFGKKAAPAWKSDATEAKAPILSQEDLFHPLSQSPFADMREKGKRIETYALCPVSYEKYHEKKAVRFECPDCGFPTHATEQRWEEGKVEHHAESCPRLREVNEDDHDMRSGRRLTEFENMPGAQPYEQAVSLATWDSFFFTRGFVSINSPRAIRHVSKAMTYPISVLAVLHQFGPFQVSNGRVTAEGRRTLAALHTTIHPPAGTTIETAADVRPGPPVRIFLLGARAESTLPAELWLQISHLFPTTQFNIYFIGPEVGVPLMEGERREHTKLDAEGSQYGVPTATVMVTPQVKLVSIQSNYEDVHTQFGPFDPYQDIFFAFSPGLGFPDQSLQDSRHPGDAPLVQAQTSWHKALKQILETKCGLFFTAFSPTDLARDVSALYGTQPPTAAPNAPSEYPSTVTLPTEPIPPIEGVTDEFELILTPGQNPFGSRKWEIAEWDPRVAVKTNWGIWGIRGKRYAVVMDKDDE